MQAYLIEEPYWNVYNYIPINIISIDSNKLFPVTFEYRQKGYKGLYFMERLNKIKW